MRLEHHVKVLHPDLVVVGAVEEEINDVKDSIGDTGEI